MSSANLNNAKIEKMGGGQGAVRTSCTAMRSLLLAPEPPVPARSGLPLRVLHLARALAEEVELEVVALGEDPAPATSERFALAHLPGDWSRTRGAVRAAWEPSPIAQTRSRAIGRYVRHGRWDVVHVHALSLMRYATGEAPCVFDAADVLTGVKRSLAATDSRLAMRPWWQFESVKARRIEGSAARSASAVTVPTDADAETFERLGARRVIVVQNGVDLETTSHELPASGAEIILVGYFAWRPNSEAGLELCREILPRIRSRVPSARVTLVGAMAPPELSALAGPTVELTGGVETVLPYLRRARVTVMAVRAGGGSRIKVLEALAAGIPVVATSFAVSGIDVRDGVEALIAETPQDLAALAVRVINDDDLARALSRAGRRVVEKHYGWPTVARPFVSLHRELGESSSGP
jgi:glycosyltransferase involved in cell wall biosynthesis